MTKIELRGVSKAYGRLAVLKDVSFELESGQLICLLGSNGAGKTTLLRIVSGLLSADEGQLLVDGQEWQLKSPEWRRICALVAHKTFLYQNLSGLENLLFFSRLYNRDHSEKELHGSLAEAGLARAADKQVRTYSRGMQQRLTIARAMLSEPKMVILDEPFTGLDKDGSAWLLRVLSGLKDGGAMVLMTSHDPQATLPVTNGFIRLTRGHLGGMVWARGKSWSELEPLLYDVSTPAFEEQFDAGETSRSDRVLGPETGTISSVTIPSLDSLRPTEGGSGGRGVTKK